ncbi:MAG: FecR domain-containing protein, partial [Sedimentisphaerales bacterium]|nr:FecR domain-containing protein [Sedimentisphaerales bacterium]
MNERKDAFEENIEKMLGEGLTMPKADFPDRLAEAVLAEVGRERNRRLGRMWLRRVSAAAAVVVVVVCVAILHRGGPRPLGRIEEMQGVVLLSEPGQSRPAAASTQVHARQTIRTLSGSKATIQLADESQLRPAPRTVLQLARKGHGTEVVLERGALSLKVARQGGGRYMSVRTPTARLRILGTELDVRLSTKPDGAQRTTVNVHSGAVELGSGDRRTLLLPGTVGIVDEGSPPQRRSACFEVNLLNDLIARTQTLARQSGDDPGSPTIIDAVGAVLWVV